jgi:hypothetical protein
MSLLIVALQPERILVAVDSVAGTGDGSFLGEASKLHVLPHLNAVLAGRGHVGVLGMALMLGLEPRPDFDALADVMPGALTAGVAHLVAHGLLQDAAPQEVVLAGWSPRLNSMRACAYARHDGGAFIAHGIARALMSPGGDFRADTAPWPQSIEDMEHIAREQVAWMRKTHPHAACGGRLLVADVRRDTVAVSARGALG